MNGVFPPTPAQEVESIRVRLAECGVAPDQIAKLVSERPLELIRKQLDWLPYRKAKKPAALIVAAIERDFEAPAELMDGSSGSSLIGSL